MFFDIVENGRDAQAAVSRAALNVCALRSFVKSIPIDVRDIVVPGFYSGFRFTRVE
jgi:hypothetical protein